MKEEKTKSYQELECMMSTYSKVDPLIEHILSDYFNENQSVAEVVYGQYNRVEIPKKLFKKIMNMISDHAYKEYNKINKVYCKKIEDEENNLIKSL